MIDADGHIVYHRITGERRYADDLPPADLDEAAKRYDYTRGFFEDALDAIGLADPADIGPVMRLQIGRWWREQPGYRTRLEDMCEDT